MALTDHNSAKNCPAFDQACRKEGIIPLFGAEVTSREEVHLLALFGSLSEALGFDDWVYNLLPNIPNDPDRFGDQVVVNLEEEILFEVEKLLLPGIDAAMDEIEAEVHRRGGLFIPAHIDRSSYSMFSQLGFLPEGDYDAVEITRWPPPPGADKYSLVCDSDAHYLEEIGRRTFLFEAHEPSFATLTESLSAGRTDLSIQP